jgi:hypothetical protein
MNVVAKQSEMELKRYRFTSEPAAEPERERSRSTLVFAKAAVKPNWKITGYLYYWRQRAKMARFAAAVA